MKKNILVAAALTLLAYVAYPAIIVAVAAGVSGCSLEPASESGTSVDAGDDAERRYDGTDSYYSGTGRYERSLPAQGPSQNTLWSDLKEWLADAPLHMVGLACVIAILVGFIGVLMDKVRARDRKIVEMRVNETHQQVANSSKSSRIYELQDQVYRLENERRQYISRLCNRADWLQDEANHQLSRIRQEVREIRKQNPKPGSTPS